MGGQQLFQILLTDGGHLDDHKPGGQGLVQLPGPGVAVVHGGDEPGRRFHGDAVITRHIDDPAEIQRRVQYRQRLVFCHVDLIQNAKAAESCALVDGAGAEAHLPIFKGVHSDQSCGVHIHMKGNVPGRAAKHHCQVFCQDIFAGSLSASKQQVLTTQQGGSGILPDVFPVIVETGCWDSLAQLLRQRIGLSKGSEFPQ